MKERGVILNAEMVRAVLDGRKTQIRHIVKGATNKHIFHGWVVSSIHSKDEGRACWSNNALSMRGNPIRLHCPLGKIGDRLWVRETFCIVHDEQFGEENWIDYRATPKYSDKKPAGWDVEPNDPEALNWAPSTHMPRWASRITLEITDIRVEHLQDISDQDVLAEGVITGRYGNDGNWREGFYLPNSNQPHQTAKAAFCALWQSMYGVDSFYKNPWVWVIEFKKVE